MNCARSPVVPALLILLCCFWIGARPAAQSPGTPAFGASDLECDVCVYGATAAGVIAALQAADEGRTVVLLDCDRWVGGLTTGGLGATDVGNKDAIGGLSRAFYRLLRQHYGRDEAWTRELREEFRGRGHRQGEDCAWTFEPSVAQRVMQGMLAERNIEALPFRLDRSASDDKPSKKELTNRAIVKQGARLVRLHCENGTRIAARVFLDCSYEGDLLAAAGCSFVVGREANATYGETLNGVQTKNATKHQFTRPVDPYVVPGDPSSGLLPHIQAVEGSHGAPGGDVPGVEGAADQRVQAYCFRMCLTDVAENRAAWRKPSGYRSEDYELLLRYFEAGSTRAPWHPVWMPNRKTDTNNNRAFSTDFIGGNYGYPTASYAERERIVAAHLRYQQGLMWTLANDERVPESVRVHFQRLGPARDEFAANGNWPPVLYVREGRRLIGEHVVSERHCMGLSVDADPVGMGAYSMDSHNVQRYVDADGHVRNEGDVQVRVPKPYGISFRALQPRRGEADNLLVPVCVSSSHIAFGSIRMEPVFMVLAQSAAIAAGLAIDGDVAVQDIAYGELKEKLLAAGQILSWPVSPR